MKFRRVRTPSTPLSVRGEKAFDDLWLGFDISRAISHINDAIKEIQRLVSSRNEYPADKNTPRIRKVHLNRGGWLDALANDLVDPLRQTVLFLDRIQLDASNLPVVLNADEQSSITAVCEGNYCLQNLID